MSPNIPTHPGAVLFLVRAQVDENLVDAFDEWYRDSHLPLVTSKLGLLSAWRFWSTSDVGVHFAVYEFASMDAMQTAMASPGLDEVIADFDRTWPRGVTRKRELLSLVDHMTGEEAAQRLAAVPHEEAFQRVRRALGSAEETAD